MMALELVMRRNFFSRASLFFFFVLIVIDQGAKAIAENSFSFRVICNSEGSWGLLLPVPVLVVLSLGILVVMIGIQWNQRLPGYPFLFLFAGGIGNLIDRLVRGCVVDFISFSSFLVFNIADIYLTLGCFFVVASYFFGNPHGEDYSHEP